MKKAYPQIKKNSTAQHVKDERKDQKLVSMIMMKNVKAKGEIFVCDEILVPFSGNTYRVKIKVIEAGNKLEVRGYVGLSLFDRTQIWERNYGE